MRESTPHDFKDGDQVRLKSGGPAMTIEVDRTDGFVSVYWFDGAQLQHATFDHRMLTSAATPTPPKSTAHPAIVGLTFLGGVDHRLGLGR